MLRRFAALEAGRMAKKREPQTIVRASDPRGLVSVIPAQFGYRPENSIVVLPMRRKRTVGGARLELDQAKDARTAARAALPPIIAVYQPEAILIAVFTDTPLTHTPAADDVALIDTRTNTVPSQNLVDSFRDEAARLGIPTMIALYIGPDGFCEYGPPADEQTEANVLTEFWGHAEAVAHPEIIGAPVARDPRVLKRESDAKTREVLQRLLDEREQNRLANAEARDGHEQSVDPHSHAA